MQNEAYQQGAAYPSYTGYPPPSPSSPYYQPAGGQRRWSAEHGRPHTPSSRSGAGAAAGPAASGSGGYYRPPSRSPLSQAGAAQAYRHAASPSDEYEERDLGEIAAANQAAQETRWGPHTALSEAAERTVGQVPGRYSAPPNSMPVIPQYEPEHYDGGYYLGPPPNEFGAGAWQGVGPPSIASSHTLGANSRRSLPVYRSPSAQPSVTSPASEPPNIFNVNARHHLPGSRARPEDMYASHPDGPPENLPNFPAWSQTWYGGHLSADGHAYTMVPPGSGQSGWESETLSHGRPGPRGASPYGPYPYGHPHDPRMVDHVKEERIRMLEKEFGPKISHNRKGKHGEDDDDEEEGDEEDEEPLPIGSVDPKGKLVLPGRKLRITVRSLQVLVSIAAAGCGIGGYLMITPKEQPGPRNKLPTWALYIFSVISTLVCLWLFVMRPMCANPLRKADTMSGGPGGLVIPVLGGGPGGPGGKKGGAAGPTVNLIVDPSLLGGQGRHHSDSESDDESDTGDHLPGEERRRRRRRHRKKHGLGMIGNLKVQAAWSILRKWLKITTFVDALLCLLWIVVAVWTIGVGEKCSPGTFDGWCDVYNGAIACAAIAAAMFVTAVYVDIRDLKACKRPPKARI